jgi:tRNA U34 5-methylaminomethyl-2-thiouridine-forming methyltransferase MnmC
VSAAADPAAWRPLRTADGSLTLVHPGHGEACHNRAGAWLEARERYGSVARMRATELGAGAELALLDVGTGLGWNLAAALEVARDTGVRLCAVTLESEPAVIAAARNLFVHSSGAGEDAERLLASVHAALFGGGELRLDGRDLGVLELRLGDARATLATGEAFDVIFFDPFSRAADDALWSDAFLRRLARALAPRGLLATYSAAAGMRALLASEGSSVGPGPRVGTKAEGTIAGRGRTDVRPLDARRAAKLERRVARIRAALPERAPD